MTVVPAGRDPRHRRATRPLERIYRAGVSIALAPGARRPLAGCRRAQGIGEGPRKAGATPWRIGAGQTPRRPEDRRAPLAAGRFGAPLATAIVAHTSR